MNKKNKIVQIITYFLIGAALISGFLLRSESILKTEVIHPLSKDAREYFLYAYNLRMKNTYSKDMGEPDDLQSTVTPDAVRYPGYPLFLAIFVNSLPNDKMLSRIFTSQMLISLSTIIVVFFFLKGFLPALWAAMASLLVALSPHLVVANSYLLTECVFTFLLVLLGWLFVLFVKGPSSKKALFVGMAIGLGLLVRPSLSYFIVLMAFFIIFHYGGKRGSFFFLSMLLGLLLVTSPWFIRNLVTLKKMTDTDIIVRFLHHGLYPDMMLEGVPESSGFPYAFDPQSKRIGKDIPSVLNELGNRFRNETSRHLQWFFINKPLVFWSWDMIQGQNVFIYGVSKSPYYESKFFKITCALMKALHWPLVIFGLIGSVLVWLPCSFLKVSDQSGKIARFASLLLIYFIAIHMVGAPFPRYSVPLRPYMYGMALHTLFLFLLWMRSWRNPQPETENFKKLIK